MSANRITRRSSTCRVAASGTRWSWRCSARSWLTGDSVRTFHAGVAGEAWAQRNGPGLAAALLTAGVLADDHGHRRVFGQAPGLRAGSQCCLAFPERGDTGSRRAPQVVAGGDRLAWPRSTRAARSSAPGCGHEEMAGGVAGGRGTRPACSPVGRRRWSAGAVGLRVEAAAAAAGDDGRSDADPVPRTTAAARSASSPASQRLAAMTFGSRCRSRLATGPSASTLCPVRRRRADDLVAFAAVELRHAARCLTCTRWPAAVSRVDQRRAVHRSCRRRVDELRAGAYEQSLHISELGSAAVLATWCATSMVALAAVDRPAGEKHGRGC